MASDTTPPAPGGYGVAVVSDDTLAHIAAALRRLTQQQHRAAQRELCVYPVQMHGLLHPDDGGPLTGMHKRVLQALDAAVAGGLDAAAAWMQRRMGIACSDERIEYFMGCCVPDGAGSALVVAVARRLVADRLKLIARPGTGHSAVSRAAALFQEMAEECADDVGLIDEVCLSAAVEQQGWQASFEPLVRVCGLVRVGDSGRLALRHNRYTVVKAALVGRGRSATVREIADSTGRSEASVAVAFSVCDSIVRTGPGRWAVDVYGGALTEYVAAAEACTDDAGLIDEDALAAAAASSSWSEMSAELARICGFVRVSGRLAVADTAAAAAKALLLARGGSATIEEIAKATGRPLSTLRQALWRCESTVAAGDGAWAVSASEAATAAGAADNGDAAAAGAAGSDPGETFMEMVTACTDDAGLIDEEALAAAAASAGCADRLDDLIAEHGLCCLFGVLAVAANTLSESKSALMSLDRPAAVSEVASMVGRTAKAVQHVFGDCPSIVRVGHSAWAVDADGRLALFAQAVQDCTDEVGLVDEARLRAMAEDGGYGDRVDDLVAAAAMVRLFGRLAVSQSAAASVKAVLIDFDRPAGLSEIVERTGLRSERVSTVLSLSRSLPQVGSDRWVAAGAAGGVYERFAQAVQACTDDVGLIDGDSLAEAVNSAGLGGRFDEMAEACALVRMHERLAVSRTAATAVKAAMAGLGRPVQMDEIVQMTGYSYSAVQHAISRCESIIKVRHGYWGIGDSYA